MVLQQQHCPPGVSIRNDLQTNGILLNDEWCRFLKEHGFLVGLSIDGPRALHDKYRVTRSGKPTFDLVMAAAALLRQHQVPFNALTVINRHNAKYPLEVYRFLTQELGASYIQFTPCVEASDFKRTAPQFWNDSMLPLVGSEMSKPGHPMSIVTDWSVDPDDWGTFLATVFEEWVNNDLGRVLVNLFETAVAQTMGYPPSSASPPSFAARRWPSSTMAASSPAITSSIRSTGWGYQTTPLEPYGLLHPPEAFGMSKRDSLPEYCRQCPYLTLCWGECPKNRLIRAPDGELGLNYLCPGSSTSSTTPPPYWQA